MKRLKIRRERRKMEGVTEDGNEGGKEKEERGKDGKVEEREINDGRKTVEKKDGGKTGRN